MSKDKQTYSEHRGLGNAKPISPKPSVSTGKTITRGQGGAKNSGAKPPKK